jgi:predicted FMN-binding regulatory protein PaiB
VTGPDAYISPSWYEQKRIDGKVVPTWDYTAVHLTGTATVHEDPEWLRAAVTELTDAHETGREHPWAVTDAPPEHIDFELTGIVGIEVTVTSVEGKAKLNQNYPKPTDAAPWKDSPMSRSPTPRRWPNRSPRHSRITPMVELAPEEG